MPSAAAVPITVAIREEETARITVFLSAIQASSDLKSSTYHLKLKPENYAVLADALNEKSITVRIGI